MILLLAVVVGLLATITRARLTNRTLKLPPFHLEWLVFVSVVPQIFAFYVPATGKLIPESIIPYLLIFTMVGLVIFAAANLGHPGFWALGLGLLSNFIVIVLNGGWMPILPETLHRMIPSKPIEFWEVGTRLGYTKDRILGHEETIFVFLSDIFTLPQWIPYKVAFSIGDVFISIGAFILLWSLSQNQKE